MRGDFHKHSRAAGLCVLGAVLQVVFAASMISYGVLSRDSAAVGAACFMGVGVVVWLVLAILFDQHRRERIEAIEAQTLAADRGGTSVFESRPEEFRVAARRLAAMYKWFLPITSVLLGAGLIGIAAWRFFLPYPPPEVSASSLHMGWGLGLGLAIAFVGFVFGRYTSGMAKESDWANLRAGSAFAVGSALLGLVLGVAHFVDYVGPDAVLRWVHLLIPVFIGVIGLEMFLNLVLDIYRPRKAGETPRPAFDSRLLGFVAAPDRIAKSISDAINYQLGFDFTSGWFYQLLSRNFWRLIIAGVCVTWGLTCLAVLQPHQQGVILRFGKPVQTGLGPGLHFKLPWPIDSVYIPEYIEPAAAGRRKVQYLTATGVRTIQLGTLPPSTLEPLMWTNDHVGTEVFQLVQSGAGGVKGGLSDLATVSIEVPLRYTIDDVSKFDQLAPPQYRDDLLSNVARREITLYFQTVNLDDVLGKKRLELSSELRARIEQAFDRLNVDSSGKPLGAGVKVLSCAIVGVHPPRDADVASSFEKVLDAEQRYRAQLDSAEADRVKQLTDIAGSVEDALAIYSAIRDLDSAAAGSEAERASKLDQLDKKVEQASGYAAQALARARAARWEKHMEAWGLAARQRGQVAVYEAAPVLFRASNYFSALTQAMVGARVFLVSDRVKNPWIQLNLEDSGVSADYFRTDDQKQ